MSNQITASIIFSFKGVTHTPSIDLDLDEYMQKSAKIPDLYMLIAKAGNYDLYSYEYEMLQAEPISFSNAKGMVSDYVVDGKLDIDAFVEAYRQQGIIEKLKLIAQQNMAIEDLNNSPDLQQALLDAYKLGKSDNSKDS